MAMESVADIFTIFNNSCSCTPDGAVAAAGTTIVLPSGLNAICELLDMVSLL